LKQPGKAVIWPANFDSTKTMKQGRRVRKELCVNFPKLQEIVAAAGNLALRFELVKESSRPNSWWEKTGNLIVERSGLKKRALLLALAKEIRRLRAGKAQETPKF
jgi:signal recognition particle subunit SRP19